MIEPALALVAAVFGGVGLKVIESVLNRSKVKNDLETQMRSELRGDVIILKEELDKIEAALDVWKKKYYALLVSFNELVILAKSGSEPEDIDELVNKTKKHWA